MFKGCFMNKTRIKIVSDCEKTSYECQYKVIWFLAWEGMNEDIHSSAVFDTEREAKDFIDTWITREEQYRKAARERVKKIREKKRTRKVLYIDYPP